MSTDSTYVSPYSDRYGSEKLRSLWSEKEKRQTWRFFWIILASVQHKIGLVSTEQLNELKTNLYNVDVQASLEKEKETKHDLMAEMLVFAEQCPLAAPILHAGATSADIVDNADLLRMLLSLEHIISQLIILVGTLAIKVIKYADTPTMGYTHLQPAVPTTVGYRLAITVQDLKQDLEDLNHVKDSFRFKGFRGAVGTSASYFDLGGLNFVDCLEDFFDQSTKNTGQFKIVSQVYPRKQDYRVITALSNIAQTLNKFAFDFRILSSPSHGDYRESFSEKQVGSSAMPFKKNPIACENINSLSRVMAGMPRVAWDNAAYSLLERTLDDSANRRSLLPEAFLLTEEIILKASAVISQLEVDEEATARQLEEWGPHACIERVLMLVTKNGGNRQDTHEVLKQLAHQEKKEDLLQAIQACPNILAYATPGEIADVFDVSSYIGNAKQCCIDIAEEVADYINN